MLTSLTKERLIELIFREFSALTRKGGVSWSEGWVRDHYHYTAKDCEEARASDRDRNWLEVAVDPRWKTEAGFGPWSFLDPIGYRYYIIAALMRTLLYIGEDVDVWLFNPNVLPDLFNESQTAAIAQFVLYQAELPTRNALMAVLDEADMTFEDYLASGETWTPDPIWTEWLEPLEGWRKYLNEESH